MPIWIDPLTDPRWRSFVSNHAAASVFHTPAWLSALRQTYGFTPRVLTTAARGEALENGIPFCRVDSLLTGRRLVSLPFSDHCQPLSAPPELIQALREIRLGEKLKYVELRPLTGNFACGFTAVRRCWVHTLDLRPPLEEIYRRFHPDCVRRKIRRSEREGLEIQTGRSGALLAAFFSLQVLSRRRHGLPPQPRRWFRNLLDAMGEKASIMVARFEGRPVASIMTLTHNRTLVYKYGASTSEGNRRGGMQRLLWTAIQRAKAAGIETLDLGRCDWNDAGLAVFKERWGAERREIVCYSYPERASEAARPMLLARHLPAPFLILCGRILYRHFG